MPKFDDKKQQHQQENKRLKMQLETELKGGILGRNKTKTKQKKTKNLSKQINTGKE